MPISAFIEADSDALLGKLARASKHDIEREQNAAWRDSIEFLKTSLLGIDGYIYLEFDVPRLGTRIDAVVIVGPVVFPIEFKVGERKFPRDAINQACDYAPVTEL
jgi:hypothetical protein